MIELLVAMTVLGLLGLISAVGVVALRPATDSGLQDSLRAARDRAIRTGLQVVIQADSTRIRFLPDGRVIGGSVDGLTGEYRAKP